MRNNPKRAIPLIPGLEKCPTGLSGLDDVTQGGLPRGRATLVCGGAGCGKTVLGTEFLVRGALEFNEPGVFMGFEETGEELIKNVASMGFDLKRLVARKKLALDYVLIERDQIEEAGEYDLEGLFIRRNQAINSVGAKRVVLDTIEALFAGLLSEGILHSELRRLFRWLKEKGVTAVVTGERGDETLPRNGLEEYISDCVIVLDHRVRDQVSTRCLRIVKYRGTSHGANEYPFLIHDGGLTVVPITSIKLDAPAPAEHVSTGVPQLDEMFGGKGFFRCSTVLVTGGAGSGKTSIASYFVDAACRRGERDAVSMRLLEESLTLAEHASTVAGDVSSLLHPPMLESHGLAASLWWFLESYSKRSGARVETNLPALLPLPNGAAIALFRIVQDSLMRVLRHSASGVVSVQISNGRQGLTLEITEDEPHRTQNIPSLQEDEFTSPVMRHRMAQLGGVLDITSAGAKTVITARLPRDSRQAI